MAVCLDAFFDAPAANPIIRTMQLATLLDEQIADLKSRRKSTPQTVMLGAVDERGSMLGFVEVYVHRGRFYVTDRGGPVHRGCHGGGMSLKNPTPCFSIWPTVMIGVARGAFLHTKRHTSSDPSVGF